VRPIALVVLVIGCVGAPQYTNCGDGHIDPGEQCDDGNTRSGDGCSRFCQLEDYPADAGPPDAALPDAASTDAAVPDAATPDAAAPPDAAVPDARPKSPVGDPCGADTDCAGDLCLTDQTTIPFPGGACSELCPAGGCPAGSTCTALSVGAVCLPDCTSPAGCRAGYGCVHVGAGSKVCLPK
jgi:cysteine-rich repeat protein